MGITYFGHCNPFIEYIATAQTRPPVQFPHALIIEDATREILNPSICEENDG